MRKQYKKKSKSLCGMCKYYKVGWGSRWEPREEERLRRFEKMKHKGRLQDMRV